MKKTGVQKSRETVPLSKVYIKCKAGIGSAQVNISFSSSQAQLQFQSVSVTQVQVHVKSYLSSVRVKLSFSSSQFHNRIKSGSGSCQVRFKISSGQLQDQGSGTESTASILVDLLPRQVQVRIRPCSGLSKLGSDSDETILNEDLGQAFSLLVF